MMIQLINQTPEIILDVSI